MKIALAQTNPIVGDLQGNADKILAFSRHAAALGADLVVFPELSLTGYPPLDLVEHAGFVIAESRVREAVAAAAPPTLGVVLGGLAHTTRRTGKPLHNAAYLYEGGRLVGTAYKALLPTYDVFDESRHFAPGLRRDVICWRGRRLGVHICEDLWNTDPGPDPLYDLNPVAELAAAGADVFINICASPYSYNKHVSREALIAHSARTHGIPYVFVNQVGANAHLVFDGTSCVYHADGSVQLRMPGFQEDLAIWSTNAPPTTESPPDDALARLHDALVLGIRDYFHKTGAFSKAVVGLSGGIDSAVTCALAVRALGVDHVVGVAMPSAYSSSHSIEDAQALSEGLNIALHTIPVREPVAALESALTDAFTDSVPNVAEENLQARTRGTILMALANKFNYLVLATGNKSELSVGYATLYGDMNGGLAVLGDVFKQQVYRLARYINRHREIIPARTIRKPPSAELRPGQTDQDTLPPYAILDDVLRRYVEQQQDLQQIIAATGYDAALVEDVLRQVNRNEYKRAQAAPCLRVTAKAFGYGRRLPIVMRPPLCA